MEWVDGWLEPRTELLLKIKKRKEKNGVLYGLFNKKMFKLFSQFDLYNNNNNNNQFKFHISELNFFLHKNSNHKSLCNLTCYTYWRKIFCCYYLIFFSFFSIQLFKLALYDAQKEEKKIQSNILS